MNEEERDDRLVTCGRAYRLTSFLCDWELIHISEGLVGVELWDRV